MMSMPEKLPPHDIDAEEAVIGSLLLGGEISTIALVPEDFYHEACQFIYSACVSLAERGASINQVTLAQELAKNGKLEEVGGVAYLSHALASCPTHLDLRHYADIVHRLSISRRLVDGGGKISAIGNEAEPDISKALDKADNVILEVRKHGVPSPIVTPRDRAELLMGRYDKLYHQEGGVAVKTGLYDLDYLLGGGFYDGDLIIVGARPSMGKTTLLQFISNTLALTTKVLFCSAEMGIEGVSDRDVASAVGIPIGDVRRGGYSDELYSKIVDSLGPISEMEVYYYQDMPLTTDKILQQGIAMQLRHGLGMVVVDYLGMLGDDYGRSPYDRISYISWKLKLVARKLNVPLLVAHQLNRALEQRSDKRPQLFDLRESGRLEEDADVVLFLYREDYYFTREEWDRESPQGNDDYSQYPEGVVEILIAKQRQGEANRVVRVLYDKESQKYKNMVRKTAGGVK